MTDTPTTPAVHAAFAKALTEVRAVGKDGWNGQQKFKFRGIDGVLDAVGPAFRANNLFIVPDIIEESLEPVQSANGKQMMQARVKMRYTVTHADGSSLSGSVPAEATDFADKATSKAMSVALRTFLIQSMVLPTGEKDPDEDYDEKGKPPPPPIYETPGWNPKTAPRPQVVWALNEAKQNRNREMYDKIKAIGEERFGNNNQATADDNNQNTGEQES